MAARRAKQKAMRADDDVGREAARARVDAVKMALGERGPVWWGDGAPDYNRRLARTTPYADWFANLPSLSEPDIQDPIEDLLRRASKRNAEW
jgi:hypothetical protein